MKQFNLEQRVFDDLLVEQAQKDVEVDIVIKQVIAGKSANIVRTTTNTLSVPVFSTHGEGWVFVPDEKVDEVSASITGGGKVWMDGNTFKCSGASPSKAHVWDAEKSDWVLDKAKQAELDKQATLAAGQARLVEIEQAIQAHINATIQGLGMGFTDDQSLIGKYAGYDNVFRPVAEAVGKWVAEIWYMAGQDKAAIVAGKKAIPTVDEALAQIPVFTLPKD